MTKTATPKPPKAPMRDLVRLYAVTIRSLTDCLATCPGNPQLYADHLVGAAITKTSYLAGKPAEEKARIRQALLDHELSLLPGAVNQDVLEGRADSIKDVLGADQNRLNKKDVRFFARTPMG
jgi:hypothetical protein